MRINLACGCRAVKLIRLFCTVVNEERLHGTHRDRNAGWRLRSGRAAWWRGPRANLIFVLPPNVYVGPPVGGTFWFQIFIQASSPEIWSETISGSEKVLAGKSGGLFLGYLLREKIYRQPRRGTTLYRSRPARGISPPINILALAAQYAARHRGRARSESLMFHRRKFHDARRRSVESIAHRLWTDC